MSLLPELNANPMRLFLPLLSHADGSVRQQAGIALLGIFGSRTLTYLQLLLNDVDGHNQARVHSAMNLVSELIEGDSAAHLQRPMYVECLGNLRVVVNNHEIQPLDWASPANNGTPARRVRDSFAYLVHCGSRGVRRSELAEQVWGSAHQTANLARTMTGLRHTLAQVGGMRFATQALQVTGDLYTLEPTLYFTDVQLFEQVYQLARKTEATYNLTTAVPFYHQTLQMYNGGYMADMARGQSWPQLRRTQLTHLFVRAAERLANAAYNNQQMQQCITYCQYALDADPTDSDVTVWLLRAYAQLGQTHELERTIRHYLHHVGSDLQSQAALAAPVVRWYQRLTNPARDG